MDQKQTIETYRRMCQEAEQPPEPRSTQPVPSEPSSSLTDPRGWYRHAMRSAGIEETPPTTPSPAGPAIQAPLLWSTPAIAVSGQPTAEVFEPRSCPAPGFQSVLSQPEGTPGGDFYARLMSRPAPPKPAAAPDLSGCCLDPVMGETVPKAPDEPCSAPAPAECHPVQPKAPSCDCGKEPDLCVPLPVQPVPLPQPPASPPHADHTGQMRKHCSVDLPYPDPAACAPSEQQGRLILSSFSGKISELTAILQYFYDGIRLLEICPEVGNLFICISKTEMHHLMLLARLCCSFGVDPKYGFPIRNQHWWWNASPNVIRYSRGVGVALLGAIEEEKQQITQYSLAIDKLTDENAKQLLGRIIMDEEYHIDLLSEAFAKYCC